MANGRPLPLAEIDRLFTQLADALSYAHSYGIIHRDLKPSNALIDSQGNLFLTDFGIAKLLESASPRLTQTDAIMGTPAYISPEQAQAVKVNQRSDIYSLGIILYEMVTGRVPFVAETPLAVILKHVSDPLPLPSTLKPDIPEAIEKVVLKALAKDPGDRFATVEEFLSAWKRAVDETRSTRPSTQTVAADAAPSTVSTAQPYGKPASDIRQSVPPPAAAPKSQNWLGWTAGCLIGLCLLVTIGGGAFYLFSSGVFSDAPPTQVPAPTRTQVPPPTDAPRPTATTPPILTGAVLLEDDFSDEDIWGTLDDTNGTIAYDGGRLRMRIFEQNWILWSTPDSEIYQDVRAEVTAYNNDGQPNTAFGILCYQQEVSSSYYYAVVTPSGEYAIAKAVEGETDTFLTNEDQWGTSNLIERDAPSYRVGLECGDGTLSLYVDGRLIDSVTDSTYSGGSPGLITWSGGTDNAADVSYDDFILRSLE